MRSIPTPRLKTVLATLSGTAAVLVPAACGCGSSSHTTTTTHHTTPKPVVRGPLPLRQTVIVAKRGAHAGSAAKIKKGELLAFRTTAPGVPGSGPVEVNLKISRGPATKLTVTASAKGKQSTATLTSANGKPLTLLLPQYTCELPPSPSFCPGRNARVAGDRIQIQFKTDPAIPVLIAAIAGSQTAASSAPKSGSLVAPTYTVTQFVSAHVAGAQTGSTASAPSNTAVVKAGDVVMLRTRLLGILRGAPQPVTISFDQGPSETLHVSASVPGGAKSAATLKAAGGTQIALVRLHYTCLLPPTPSFCPASKVIAGSHHYSVTFPASPLTGVTLQAVAQAG